MSTQVRNIIANYGSRAWGLVSIYLFTPIHTSILGVEAFGIISFYNLMFALIVFADAGIASAIDREFAKPSADERKIKLLLFFEKVYACICFLVSLLLYSSSEFLATNWFKTDIEADILVGHMRLISIGVGVQLMPTIFFGAMMGAQKQVQAGVIQFFWQLAKSGGGVLILLFLSQSLSAFFTWQIVCNIGAVLVARTTIFRMFPQVKTRGSLTPLQVPLEMWKYIGGMFLISVLNGLNVQLDKLFASKLFSLNEYGYYSLASIVAQAPLLATIPIVLAAFPILTKHLVTNDHEVVISVFRKYSYFISIIIFPLSAILVFFGGDLFFLWQPTLSIEPAFYRKVAVLIAMLVIGNTFFALQQMIYYLLLAKGQTRFSVIQVFVQVIILVPAIYFSIKEFGMVGAAFPVIVLNAGGYIFLLFIAKRLFFHGRFARILNFSILIPFGFTVSASVLVLLLQQCLEICMHPLLGAALIGALSFASGLLYYRRANWTQTKRLT